MTWGPEHDRPIDYVPTHETWFANDGHMHVVHRAYIEAGLDEAAQWCADEAEALQANWTVLEAYVNDSDARSRIDYRLPALDDSGRWRCRFGAWHGVDDPCDCQTTPREEP